jgi:membrane protein
MPMKFLETLRDAALEFLADRASRLGASLAYYSLFALAPLLVLSISIAGAFLGEQAAEGDLVERVDELVGPEIADVLQEGLDEFQGRQSAGSLALVSTLVLVFTASVLFVAWRDAVRSIWGLPRKRGVKASVLRRLGGFLFVLGGGLFVTAMLLAQMVMGLVDQIVDSALLNVAIRITGTLIPFLVGALFLALLYKYTPGIDIEWKHVWPGTIVAMLMLALGTWLYGLYVGTIGASSVSGVAGSVILGLVLIYYGSQILLFGIEVTKVLQRADETTEVATV